MSDRDHSTRQRMPNDTTWSEPLAARPPSSREERLREALEAIADPRAGYGHDAQMRAREALTDEN